MAESGDVELERSSLSGCHAAGDGGGISIQQGGALALTDSSSIADCSAGANGGGIAMADSGALSLIDSAVSNSIAANSGGGARFDSSASIATLVRSNMSNNRAASASAFYYSGSASEPGSVRDSRFESNVADSDGVTITAATELSWFPCRLGEWMPTRGAFKGDVLGCNACPERYYGDADNFATAGCSGICPLGHFCESGSALPVPCPKGTRMPLTTASTARVGSTSRKAASRAAPPARQGPTRPTSEARNVRFASQAATARWREGAWCGRRAPPAGTTRTPAPPQ